MYNRYIEQLDDNISIEILKKRILRRIRRDWQITEAISSIQTNICSFDEATTLSYFVKDNKNLYFCGPINLKREKNGNFTTVWRFDYLFYKDSSYQIIKDITYVWDTLWSCKLPDKFIFNPYIVMEYDAEVIMVQAKEIYNAEKIKNIYLVNMQAFGFFSERVFEISFFMNDKCLKKCNHILEVEPSPSKAGIVYYKKSGDSKYTEYDIISNTEKSKRTYAESYYLKKELEDFKKLVYMKKDDRYLEYKLNASDKVLFDNRIHMYNPDYHEYYFSVNDPITEIMVKNYFANVAKVEQIESEYEDDFSHNYRIQIRNDDKDTIYLWLYICRERFITEPALYGVELCQIIMYFKGKEIFVQDKDAVEKALESITRNVNKNPQKLIRTWMLRFPYKAMLSIHGEYLKYRDGEEKYEYYYVCEHIELIRKKYSLILQQLAEEGKINPRWKSEFSLFMLVKSYYPSAVYQYRAEWLKHQSLDIYIPDLKIGIEYQGLQHYEPIEVFGGLEAFEENQKRDAEKRVKCKENRVLLIEWSYQVSVEDKELRRLLNEHTIEIPKRQNTEFILHRDNNTKDSKIVESYIYQYDENGIFLNKYNTVKEAELATGIRDYNIQRACSGFRKTAGGFQWKELLDDNQTENIDAVVADTIPMGPREVARFDMEGNFVESYDSIAEAVRKTGVNSKSIRDAANGKQKKAGGYIWKYCNNSRA